MEQIKRAHAIVEKCARVEEKVEIILSLYDEADASLRRRMLRAYVTVAVLQHEESNLT